jgi:hypothetical protein
MDENVKDHSLTSLTEQTSVDRVGEVGWKFCDKKGTARIIRI